MKFSILDPVIVEPNTTSAQSIKNSIRLAKHVESLDFSRYWIVEHHGVHYEATPSPEILVSAIINETQKIKVGVGGILLNNYSPYKVAEIIKTLNAIHGNRVEFGIGRSFSGEIQQIALHNPPEKNDKFDYDHALNELLKWINNSFDSGNPYSQIPIMVDQYKNNNIWSLVVSKKSALRAGKLGLHLACSAFHAPELAEDSIKAFYQSRTQTLNTLLAIRLIVADTQDEAERMAMPMRHIFHQRRKLNIMPQKIPSISEAIEFHNGVLPAETSNWPMYVIGDKERVYRKLSYMIDKTGVNEIMLQDVLSTHQERIKMYDTVAELGLKLK